jgi:hypothetical protein
MKKMLLLMAGAVLFVSGWMMGAQKYEKPKSLLHIVTIRWKEGATAAQKTAALKGVETMASQIPGVTRVWTKGIKVQGEGYTDAFVMEFADAAAFKAYADHQAHKEWEKIYLPIRGESTTHDVTNP